MVMNYGNVYVAQVAKEEAKNALVARFDSILTDNGATFVESKDWEKLTRSEERRRERV